MTTLYVKKIDETTLKFACDDVGVHYELSDYFSFYAPGYKYDPRFRNHIWDGRVRLVSATKQTAPVGLRQQIQKFCTDRNYHFIDQTEEQLLEKGDDVSNFDQWLESINLPFEPRDYQKKAVLESLTGQRRMLLSPTGCHARGSKVVMANGSLKNVEDVQIGDSLLGYNGQFRTVLKLCRGRDAMYRISNKRNRFKPFVVNGEHILPLWDVMKKEMVNIEVDQYVTKSEYYKYTHYLLLNDQEIDFGNSEQLHVDPYFMGLYLGDGHTHHMAVTTLDDEISQYCYQYIQEKYPSINVRKVNNTKSAAYSYTFTRGKECAGSKNPLAEDFAKHGLFFTSGKKRTKCEDKFIPEAYLTSSVENRYKLLAGLIDTDGSLTNNSFYEFTLKSKQLCKDIIRLAKSLGFVCNFREFHNKQYDKIYYRITIVGDIEKVPVRIPRKRRDTPHNRNTDVHHIRFDVEKLEEDDYYGFELDGDHLYYNEDYVLNHNSGKSLIIYLILRWNLSKSRKCVVIVPSTSLVEQMVDDFKKYSINDDGWDAEKEVAKLYSKVNTDPFEVDALVTTWQSICRYDNSLYKTWDCIIVDEAHNAKATTLKKITEGATNAKFKIGTTGSLTGENVHEFMLTGCFGPVCQVATTKQLQDNGQLSDMDIHMLILKYPKEESKTLFREIGKDFNTEIDYINKHAKRQLFTRNLACSLKGTVMILFKLREQGETLYKLIKEKVGDSRPVFHIDGRVKASLREEIRQSINDNKGAILVASVGTSATGLNIPCIENVILCPSKSRVRNLQSIGRGLRLSEDKTICNVFDLVDDLSYGNHKNYSLKHGMERYNLYQSEGFKITFNEIKF